MKPTAGTFLRDLSLKTKTLLFIGLVTAIPVGALMWGLLTSFAQASLDVEGKALAATTLLIREELLSSVTARAKLYDLTFKNVIIGIDAVRDDAMDPARRQNTLDDFVRRNHIVSSATLYAPGPARGGTETLPADISFYDGGKPVYVGRWFGPRTSSAGAQVMTYGLPVWQGATLKGVLSFDIMIDALLSEVIDIDPSRNSYFFIVREGGQVITSSETFGKDFAIPQSEKGDFLSSSYAKDLGLGNILTARDEQHGTFDLPSSADGVKKTVTYVSVPTFGARLFVVTPLDELIQVQKEKAADLRTALQRTTLFGLIAILLLGLLIGTSVYFFFDLLIVVPLRKMMKGIMSLERVNFAAGIEVPVRSNDEIGMLASRFNSMAARLRESYEGLEKKVEERTAEISRNLVVIERLNKFMVGRELRMRELKDEVDRLHGEKWPSKKA
ncbi:MAG: hypothetical protein RLZZ324_623 [Candidatus Parcubacteria bacterium]|jgi:HAMP domain-containing protein